jgi:hypothetical protein
VYRILRSRTAAEPSRSFHAGTLKGGVRWKTVTWAASLAMIGTTWTADDPAPMTPTRLPAK